MKFIQLVAALFLFTGVPEVARSQAQSAPFSTSMTIEELMSDPRSRAVLEEHLWDRFEYPRNNWYLWTFFDLNSYLGFRQGQAAEHRKDCKVDRQGRVRYGNEFVDEHEKKFSPEERELGLYEIHPCNLAKFSDADFVEARKRITAGLAAIR